MKNNKRITIILTLFLAIGGSASAYSYNEQDNRISLAHKTISTLNKDVKTKSTKIANLENVVAKKDTELKARKLVIDEQKLQINKQEKEKIKLKEENDKLKEQVNFNNQRKGSDVKRQASNTMPSRGKSNNYRSISVVATGYIALCDTGCTGITRTGIDVRNTPSKQIIAVDPSVIPLHSKVKVSLPNGDVFYAIAEDTGGDIKGNRIDILFATYDEAVSFGKQNVTVTILK